MLQRLHGVGRQSVEVDVLRQGAARGRHGGKPQKGVEPRCGRGPQQSLLLAVEDHQLLEEPGDAAQIVLLAPGLRGMERLGGDDPGPRIAAAAEDAAVGRGLSQAALLGVPHEDAGGAAR